jgi:FHS family L-fucose permease-like MFS transporter
LSPGNTLPFVLVTAMSLFWGIPSNMNDILIKQFMNSFEINRFRAGLIQSAFYMGYFLLATPAALVMRKHSYKTGRSSGCCIAWGPPSGLTPMLTLRSPQMS